MAEDVAKLAKKSHQASVRLAAIPAETTSRALRAMADALEQNAAEIFAANTRDMEAGTRDSLEAPLLKRLAFDEKKLSSVCAGLRQLADMDSPVGHTQLRRELDNGLILERVSCPIGVIGMIFESRPDALVQIAGLCAKSGNAVILKGGREAAESNRILSDVLYTAGVSAGLPEDWLTLVETREDVAAMLHCEQDIDLLIPRGSNEFVSYIMQNTSIPVLGHADGICHVYIDKSAELDMAVSISLDSKTQYLAVCNAAETILIHSDAAQTILPPLFEALCEADVEVRACKAGRAIVPALPAEEEDWKAEYLDAIVSIKIVESLQAAIDHINTYGSGHTDAIVTADEQAAESFMQKVDTANAFWNASTRFADGFRYGLGAEVGISTAKIHARGPVGIEGLLIYQWRLRGNGHTVAPYANGTKNFTHRDLQ